MRLYQALALMLIATYFPACATSGGQQEQKTSHHPGMSQTPGPIKGGSGASPGHPAGSNGSAGTIIPHPSAASEYMDMQERELNAGVAKTEDVVIYRSDNHLSVTFRSDFFFDVDSAELKSGALPEIELLAGILLRYPDTRIKVNAFTDSTGSEQYNLELSEKRAAAIMDAFTGKGVEPARISAKGFGESRPIASNATENGRRANRRIIVVLSPPDA